MADRYLNQLSYGANNLVVALSDTEVAKIFRGDTRSDIGRATVRSEAEKLKIPTAKFVHSPYACPDRCSRRYGILYTDDWCRSADAVQWVSVSGSAAGFAVSAAR